MAGESFRQMLRASSPDFWRLWYVGLVSSTVRWLEMVAVGIFVYQMTGSAFLVAMMTMLRLLPMGLFGALIGALAERFDRRLTLSAVIALMAITSAALALVARAGIIEVWHLAVASFVNGLGWATDNPLRRMLMGEAVGRDHMGVAMSLDIGASNASRMLGPTLGGVLLVTIGLEGAFALSVALYATAILAGLTVRTRVAVLPGAADVLARTVEGIRLVLADRRLMAAMVVTVIYNIFAWPFTSMIPVIGRDRLHLGPEGIGLLASLDGVGAFMGAMLLAALLKTRWYAATYVGGVACTTMALIVFALATDPMMAGIALVVTGLGGLAVVLSGAWLVATGSVDAGILPLLTILAMASFLPVSEIAQVGRQFAVRFD